MRVCVCAWCLYDDSRARGSGIAHIRGSHRRAYPTSRLSPQPSSPLGCYANSSASFAKSAADTAFSVTFTLPRR